MADIIRVLQNLVGRGVVKAARDGKAQAVDIETIDGLVTAEYLEPFGFTGRPKPGAEAVILQIGATSHPICISTPDRKYRITTLQDGDVAIYDANNNSIILGSSGITINGNVTIKGNVSMPPGKTITVGALSLTTHVHSVSDGGSTGGPV